MESAKNRRPLRIAVAGAGAIGRRHIELVRAGRACELAAIVDPAAGAALARDAGVAHYDTLRGMFGESAPDGVILATPNPLHVEQALECIRAGVPVLVEKPLAHSVEEATRLCGAAAAASASVLVGHQRAHSPILEKARQIIAQGTLGELVAVRGSAIFYKPDAYFDDAPWRRQPGTGPVLLDPMPRPPSWPGRQQRVCDGVCWPVFQAGPHRTWSGPLGDIPGGVVPGFGSSRSAAASSADISARLL